MTHLDLWFLAIGLAMDCLVIAISRGLMIKRIEWKEVFGIAFLFGLSPLLLSLLGGCISNSFTHYFESINHWIVFAIFTWLGLQMIWEYYKERGTIVPCAICTNFKVISLLALATSLDAFGVGLSWALLGMASNLDLFYSSFVVGLVSSLFTFVGLLFGHWSRQRSYYVRQIPVKLLGGLILLLIGGKVLLEHLSIYK